MGLITKTFLFIVLTIVVAASVLIYFGNGVQNASLQDFELNSLNSINSNSFTITGSFSIDNPSKLSIPIESIHYDVVLEETEETISTGEIPSFVLEKQSITRIPFEQEVNWVPTANLAVELLTKDKVYATVEGKIKIDLPKIEQYEIPFSRKIDIKEYTDQFVTENLGNFSMDNTDELKETALDYIDSLNSSDIPDIEISS